MGDFYVYVEVISHEKGDLARIEVNTSRSAR
jgi:hypothetical protein